MMTLSFRFRFRSVIDESVQNVSEFDVNILFACVSQSLQLITGNKELPTRLPPNISTRFKVCGELAQLCQVIPVSRWKTRTDCL